MRLSRPRFTVRRLMVAVAVVGVILGATAMYRRYLYCRKAAEFYSKQASFFDDMAGFGNAMVEDYTQQYQDHRAKFGNKLDKELIPNYEQQIMTNREESARDSADAIRLTEAADAFRRAGSRPWLSIPRHPSNIGLWLPDAPDQPVPG